MKVIALLCMLSSFAVAETKLESFDRDPNWESFNNRQTLETYPTVQQNFGYSNTNHAGEKPGEIGGVVWRTTTAAWYAMKLDKPLTFKDPIHFSGSFAVLNARGGGVKLTLFNPDELRQGGRPRSALFFEFNGAKTFVQAFIRTLSLDNRAAGSLIPPAERVKDAIPIPADGSKHRFTIDYDPKSIPPTVHAKIDDLAPAQFTLLDDFKESPMRFTHFGLLNTQKSGSPIDVYYDDIELNGEKFTFDADPKWIEHGNRDSFEDHDIAGVQDYGFSDTAFAGGAKGELGGAVWRSQKTSYYGDRVGPFTLDSELEASGVVTLRVGAPDSGAFLGFFNSEFLRTGTGGVEGKLAHFVGVHIEGPTRVGHYFAPQINTATGNRKSVDTASVIPPDEKQHRWSMKYAAGKLTVTFDDKSTTIELPAKQRKEGATLDRFGLFPGTAGGSQVRIYFDDVRYSK